MTCLDHGAPVPGEQAPTDELSSDVVAASGSVTRVAAAFARAWSSSGRSQDEWTRGIQPFVTRALAPGLAQTDPARVPATMVTGEAALVTASATRASVRVPTDGGNIVVTLTRAASGGWQVSDLARRSAARGTHPGPAPKLDCRGLRMVALLIAVAGQVAKRKLIRRVLSSLLVTAPFLIAGVLCVGLLLVMLLTSGQTPNAAGSGGNGCVSVVPASQTSSAGLDREQLVNARTIVAVGRAAKVPAYGWVVAVATAMQESGLRSLDHGDRDCLGLFQQRRVG